MTRLSEGFEGGSQGATISTGNSIFGGGIGGTVAGIFDAASKLLGAFAAKFVYAASFGYQIYLWGTNQPTQYFRGYFFFTAAPSSSQSVFLSFVSGTTQRAQLTLATTGKINMRSPATLQATSVNSYTGKWVRIEHDVVGGSQVARFYSGANLYGTTPDETITGPVTVSTGFDRVRIGSTAADTYTMLVDGVEIDSVATPGPASPPTPSDAAYIWDGSALVACDVYEWNGVSLASSTVLDPYYWDGSSLV